VGDVGVGAGCVEGGGGGKVGQVGAEGWCLCVCGGG
jgi:hypothetical protein